MNYSEQDIDEVIGLYADTVYRLAYSMVSNKADADDIFQEVFLRYIKSNKAFSDENHRKAWLIRVTVNCCKKLYASAWHKHTLPLNEAALQDNGYYDTHDEMLELINTLPLKYKTVIHLFYYEELPIKEIARLTGQKQTTVRTQLTRARNLLKERLSEDE